jgi:hypothetical protein
LEGNLGFYCFRITVKLDFDSGDFILLIAAERKNIAFRMLWQPALRQTA